MKKIGTKLSFVFCAFLSVAMVIVVAVSLVLSGEHSDSVMQNMSKSSISVLENEVQGQLTRLGSIYENIEAMGLVGNTVLSGNATELETEWLARKSYENDFAVFAKKDGTIIWNTANYALADCDFVATAAQTGPVQGVVLDSQGGLTLQYITPVIMYDTVIGSAIIGMNLSENTYLDQIGELTNAEVTIFHGDTRYATTVVDAEGNRAVGTTMSDAVKAKVIEKGEEYQGTADILGQKHYVDYEPMLDINGNIVGAYFAGYSSAETDADFLLMTIICLVAAAACAVIAIVVMAIVLRKMITKPIAEAAILADNMSSGNLGAPDSAFKFADDEIGRFVKQLEGTKHNLDSYITDISSILSNSGSLSYLLCNCSFKSSTFSAEVCNLLTWSYSIPASRFANCSLY